MALSHVVTKFIDFFKCKLILNIYITISFIYTVQEKIIVHKTKINALEYAILKQTLDSFII